VTVATLLLLLLLRLARMPLRMQRQYIKIALSTTSLMHQTLIKWAAIYSRLCRCADRPTDRPAGDYMRQRTANFRRLEADADKE